MTSNRFQLIWTQVCTPPHHPHGDDVDVGLPPKRHLAPGQYGSPGDHGASCVASHELVVITLFKSVLGSQ